MKRICMSLIMLIFILVTSCSQSIDKKSYTFYAMDTFISITFYNVNNSTQIVKEVENIYLSLENYASDYQKGNEIVNVYDLNVLREAKVDSDLIDMLKFAVDMQEKTRGFFNPFIGKLSHLWKETLENKVLLEKEVIEEQLKIMNNTNITINDNLVTINGEGNIDLGGVAKGYATSKAKEYLDSINIKNYLLNAGSSNIVLGTKVNTGFKVGLSKTLEEGYYYILNNISNKAIATSSIKEQHVFIGDTYYSHLINPKTGYPATNFDSISIIGEDSKTLDAYSTACFCMSLDEVKQFLDGENLDYLISKNDVLLFKSNGVDLYA